MENISADVIKDMNLSVYSYSCHDIGVQELMISYNNISIIKYFVKIDFLSDLKFFERYYTNNLVIEQGAIIFVLRYFKAIFVEERGFNFDIWIKLFVLKFTNHEKPFFLLIEN